MSGPAKSDLYLGLISGTSVDSVDAALVDFSADTPCLEQACSTPWPQSLRAAIFASRELPDEALGDLGDLDMQTAAVFAEAALRCLQLAGVDRRQVTAIGSHGQTIRHRPDIERPFSLQIGNAARISELTGLDVVSDFRTADIEAGGQGAPMVPAFHKAVFEHPAIDRVIVNIGGIANITTLPAAAHDAEVLGFDTGPGNNLMDAWCQRHTGKPYDEGGAFAAGGSTDAKLLASCLMDEYFRQPAPKSTGFERFNMEWLDPLLREDMDAADVQSTLCDLTATSIMRDINRYAPGTGEIYICGGGAHNVELMQRLQALSRAPVASTAALGVEPDWVEAMTFAWLARQHINHLPGNIPTVTGASGPVVLGRLSAGSR